MIDAISLTPPSPWLRIYCQCALRNDVQCSDKRTRQCKYHNRKTFTTAARNKDRTCDLVNQINVDLFTANRIQDHYRQHPWYFRIHNNPYCRKTNKCCVLCLAKTHISLTFPQVWAESSLSPLFNLILLFDTER